MAASNRWIGMIAMTTETTANTIRTAVADDPRWAQIVARDSKADGVFWYSV
jgi:hypothetical protein